jgi:hypothetical protein
MLPEDLSPRQRELLDRLAQQARGIPEAECDGRIVRGLVIRELVEKKGDLVRLTPKGRGGLHTGEPGQGKPLSVAQEDLLRRMDRSPEALPSDELDGRVVRALMVRGFVVQEGESTQITPAGRAHLQEEQPSTPPLRRRGRPKRADPRAKVIFDAVKNLEHAIPRDSELMVGRMFVHVDDLLDSFRKLARRRTKRP